MADDDLGANLQPQPDMMKVLSDPRVRNGLLSFAAQAFTGGWGGPVSQFGQAMGHGLESAGSTEEIQKKHEQQQQELEQKGTIASEHNKTQKEIAEMHNQAIKDVANIRGGFQAGKNGPHDSALYNGVFKAALNEALLNPSIPQEDRVAYAHQQATQAVQNHRSLSGGGMSETQTGAQPTVGQPGQKTGTTPKKTTKEPWDESKIDLEKFKTDPAYREKLSSMGYRSEVEGLMNKTGVGPLQSLLRMLRPKGGVTPPGGNTAIPGETGG